MNDELVLSVSDFVAVFNQTIDYAYPSVTIAGELTNFRISKNRWVYFDLKDELSSVKFFGTVQQHPGPLEDGLMVQVRGVPRLHNQFGFSLHVQSITPIGEGSIKKANALLEAKLAAEGLFDESRKRPLPRIPHRIGLITSSESAAFYDFNKIIDARWGGVVTQLYDVQVQGESSPAQIVAAITYFNEQPQPIDVLVITRGGGSAEDLAAFSTEQVVRAVAASRIPTLVAIGHEVDVSLAELAADLRASTPSNAAELLVPDKQNELAGLAATTSRLDGLLEAQVIRRSDHLLQATDRMTQLIDVIIARHMDRVSSAARLLAALNPRAALQRGYALLSMDGNAVKSVKSLTVGNKVQLELVDGHVTAEVTEIQ